MGVGVAIAVFFGFLRPGSFQRKLPGKPKVLLPADALVSAKRRRGDERLFAAAPIRDVPPFPHRERVPAADRRATTGDRAAPPPGAFL